MTSTMNANKNLYYLFIDYHLSVALPTLRHFISVSFHSSFFLMLSLLFIFYFSSCLAKEKPLFCGCREGPGALTAKSDPGAPRKLSLEPQSVPPSLPLPSPLLTPSLSLYPMPLYPPLSLFLLVLPVASLCPSVVLQ